MAKKTKALTKKKPIISTKHSSSKSKQTNANKKSFQKKSITNIAENFSSTNQQLDSSTHQKLSNNSNLYSKKTNKKNTKTKLLHKEQGEKQNENNHQQLDWITKLAQEASRTDTYHSSHNSPLKSKAERIRKRQEKKQKRTMRKMNMGLTSISKSTSTNAMGELNDVAFENGNKRKQSIRDEYFIQNEQSQYREQSQTNLLFLSQTMEEILQQYPYYKQSHSLSNKKPKFYQFLQQQQQQEANFKQKKYIPGQTMTFFETHSSNTTTNISNAKKQKMMEQLQPRPRDYGGLGIARPSLAISLRDPSFIPKLQEEFAEHIQGFFGKQRTKAMKKQLDGNMLWRKLMNAKKGKQDGSGGGGEIDGKRKMTKKIKGSEKGDFMSRQVDGVKLADMSVEERVEAMIKVGMI